MDSSERTREKMKKMAANSDISTSVIETGSQQAEISSALGLPLTGVFGIKDKNFAGKIMEYWLSETERRRH